MTVRKATADDSERIREIAEQSFQASYALSPLDIESIVEIEFESDQLASRLDEDGCLMLVAEGDAGDIVGFTEGQVTDDSGEIRWLHVDPTERGYGIGTALFERVLADLRDHAVDEIHATVLADNQEGGEFFQQFQFESHDTVDREFDERTLNVEVYRNEKTESAADEGREKHFGFYCTNCGTFTDSVDGQGRVVCEECGNEHRPEEWDDSYL